jgi:putative ABC transport system ATP-binding protein
VDGLRHMVEDHDVAIEAEMKIRDAAVVARRGRERKLRRLEIADAVEACETHESAGEGLWKPQRRERLRRRRAERRGEFAQEGERVFAARGSPGLPAMVDHGRVESAGGQLDGRPRAEDRMAPDRGAVLDRLEEEARRGALVRKHEPPIGEDRGQLVAHQAPREQHQRTFAALRIEGLPELVCGRLLHGAEGSKGAAVRLRLPSPTVSVAPSRSTADSTAATPPAALLRGIRKTYYKPDGSVLVDALRGLDLVIPRGEYVAIMGASGSGKSTLMNILGCLDRPTAGTYELDGQAVEKLGDDELSRVRGQKIGFVFQAFNLIPELTIAENVEIPLLYQGISRTERRERALESLRLVGLENRTEHRPSELSGGQQQRSAIARALVGRPAILMADEPTGNLDSTTGRQILETFEDLHARGLTLIMVTHDDRIAERCERVVRLADGDLESDRDGGGRTQRRAAPGAGA